MDVDVQGYGTSGFGDDFNSDFDFDALCRSLTPSAFLACMPTGFSDTAPEQNTTALAQHTYEFSAGAGDNFPGIFSPVPNYGLSIHKPRDTLKSIESCTDNGRTCIVSALKILQALHIPPPACLWACDETSMPSPRQPRMIDSVLSTNRDVVLSISEMLKCSCSSSSQLQLVLTIICGKLMAWYRAMTRNDYHNSSPTVRSIVNNNIIDEEQTERVLHQPITVGEYSFDVALESKIRAQVVFSELQHLEALVENLSSRSQEAKFGDLCTAAAARSGSASTTGSGSMTPDETGLGEGIHRSLSVFLHKQLQATKAETLLC
ncbi:hypothetical protein MMC30_003725 [Trapelia coarctata]|nr:hypothetical protein [Trapelia coarctata]